MFSPVTAQLKVTQPLGGVHTQPHQSPIKPSLDYVHKIQDSLAENRKQLFKIRFNSAYILTFDPTNPAHIVNNDMKFISQR